MISHVKKRYAGISRISIVIIIIAILIIAGIAYVIMTQWVPTHHAVKTIRIGICDPISGAFAPLGTRHKLLSEIMIEKINAEGGIYVEEYGRKLPIELVIYDHETNPQRAVELTTKMIVEDNVVAIFSVGDPSTALPMAQLAEKYHVPLFIIIPAEVFLTLGPVNYTWDFSWYLGDVMKLIMGVLDQYRVQTNEVVGIWAVDDPDGHGWHDSAIPVLEQAGYTICDPGFYPPGTKDFTAIITQYKNFNVEILLGQGYAGDFASFWRQCALQGFKPKMAIILRAIMFEEDIKTIGGDLPLGLMTELHWSLRYPFPWNDFIAEEISGVCLLYTSPSPRDLSTSRMPSSA